MIINEQLINKFIYVIFFLIFGIGILIFKDYGLTLDDEHYRVNGVFYKDFIKEYLTLLVKFNFTELNLLNKEIETGSLKNHPVIFETVLAFISDLLNYNDTEDIYNLSHLLNFTIYTLSLYLFYNIILNRYKSPFLGALAVILIFISPRFFAESFYNSRDVFFFSIFIFFLYVVQKLINENNIKNLIILGFSSALLINAKILGIIPVIIFILFYSFYIFDDKKNTFKNLKTIFIILLSTFFFIVLLWPYLWFNPVDNFIKGYSDIIKAHNNLVVLTYFSGEYLSSTNTPWYFRIVWFLISTPVIVITLFITGFLLLIKKMISRIMRLNEKNVDIWNNKLDFFDFYLAISFIFIIFLTVKFNDSQFNGWRHLYFLYGIILYLSVYGYTKILSLNNNFIKKILNFLIIFSIIYNSLWIIKNHPYQNNYFNFFSNKYVMNKFDLDYWGLSNFQAIEYILKNDNKNVINIGSISFADLNMTILKLNTNNRKRLNVVYDYNKADYLIESYMKRIRKNAAINEKMSKKYYEIQVNKIPLNTVYKKVE